MINPNIISRIWHKILVSAFILLLLPLPLIAEDNPPDLLAYITNPDNEGATLKLYDPRTHQTTTLLTNIDFLNFEFSADGRIAFSSSSEGNAELYVFDTQSINSQPIAILSNAATNEYPLAWSPDGRYLALWSGTFNQNGSIFVWNGETLTDITPSDTDDVIKEYYDAAWSPDGRLAFTVWYGQPFMGVSPSEIYLWDGSSTINLSQNPAGEDRASAWSADGRLAFLSWQNTAFKIVVWDGISLKNGSPDVKSFVEISPPGLVDYFFSPVWTSNGFLAFEKGGSQGEHSQIYLWDGSTATNISQNPTMHNGGPRWSNDGRWAFVTYFSSQQLLYVRDAENHPLLTTEGQYTPAWSSDGNLIFCRDGWALLMWDGEKIIQIARSLIVSAQWQGGSGVFCSSG